ncbi:MAG: hypothetical protein IPL10_03680 [Bacteroidetes bacterium]|jgi:hypothetical protein|nr:hypothetical protein [Bacteroidota bacterium]
MKLFNIFKKESSKEVKSNIQKMDKNQLSKVIGGVDDSSPDSTTAADGGPLKGIDVKGRAVSTQGVK